MVLILEPVCAYTKLVYLHYPRVYGDILLSGMWGRVLRDPLGDAPGLSERLRLKGLAGSLRELSVIKSPTLSLASVFSSLSPITISPGSDTWSRSFGGGEDAVTLIFNRCLWRFLLSRKGGKPSLHRIYSRR